MLIGVCGKKGSGKDTFANFIQKICPSVEFQKMSFAKPLKDICHDIFGIDKKFLWGSDADKNTVVCVWGKYFKQSILEKYGKDQYDLMTAREFMQVLGTDCVRQDLSKLNAPYRGQILDIIQSRLNIADLSTYKFDATWIDLLLQEVKSQSADIVFCVPDVRFINELNAIRNAGGILVRLHRDTGLNDSLPHPSELEMNQMTDDMFDFVVHEENNETLDDLKKEVIRFLMQFNVLPVSGERA